VISGNNAGRTFLSVPAAIAKRDNKKVKQTFLSASNMAEKKAVATRADKNVCATLRFAP
jgi:hypothetical protein